MPKPGGEYSVGTKEVVLTNQTGFSELKGRKKYRNIIPVQIWYPTEKTSGYVVETLLDEKFIKTFHKSVRLSKKNLSNDTATHSYLNAPISDRKNWPVLIYNHGYGNYALDNYFLMEELASRGYVVVSISHPFHSMISQYPNGANVYSKDYWNLKELITELKESKNRQEIFLDLLYSNRMDISLDKRHQLILDYSKLESNLYILDDRDRFISNTEFVIHSLPEISQKYLEGTIDTTSVGLFGFSFGGNVAGRMAIKNPGIIKAGLNMDGLMTLREDETVTFGVPFMIMYSEVEEESPSGMNDLFYLSSEQPVYRFCLKYSYHFNFTSFTYFDGLWPSNIEHLKIGKIIREYTVAFFDKYLKGKDSGILLKVPQEYPEVSISNRNL